MHGVCASKFDEMIGKTIAREVLSGHPLLKRSSITNLGGPRMLKEHVDYHHAPDKASRRTYTFRQKVLSFRLLGKCQIEKGRIR